ncbi:hypothetical protein [Kitasatospora phosalacinea]|uniref:Aminoacyl-transfer RNA synthetases class-II family profile domain-containing protein n=1 Tax=Kitasatospora phosalacinea TaxID=2065 RepID=A0ABW6GL55_9ACTN
MTDPQPEAAALWRSPAALAPAQRRTFDDLLAYCVPDPAAVVARHTEEGTTVRLPADPGWPVDRVRGLLDDAFARAGAAPPRDPKVLVELGGRHRPPTPEQAVPADSTHVGPGLNVSGPGVARLMRALDRVFLDLARRAGAEEHAVPHLVSWETVERAGYHRTFPQHLTPCAVAGPDLAALDRFAAAAPEDRMAELRPAPVVLAPAVCLSLFAALADSVLDRPFVGTATGGCARHEAGTVRSTTRLWAFTMREVVFVGEPAAARAFRDAMLDRVAEFARELDLPSTLLSANDPFFTRERGDLATFQSSFDLKHELLGRTADGSPVAVTSVNLHQQHFGTGFGITLPSGAPAHSTCVGFGLERWAQWIHGHLGSDPAAWPDPLRAAAA